MNAFEQVFSNFYTSKFIMVHCTVSGSVVTILTLVLGIWFPGTAVSCLVNNKFQNNKGPIGSVSLVLSFVTTLPYSLQQWCEIGYRSNVHFAKWRRINFRICKVKVNETYLLGASWWLRHGEQQWRRCSIVCFWPCVCGDFVSCAFTPYPFIVITDHISDILGSFAYLTHSRMFIKVFRNFSRKDLLDILPIIILFLLPQLLWKNYLTYHFET